MTPRRRALASVLLTATTTAGLAALHVPAAQAATGSAPVTAPDAVTLFAGGSAQLNPIKNDADPDGDDLAVCRVAEDPTGRLMAFNDPTGSRLLVSSDPRTKPGTYTLTYYACDFTYLTPGTITVTVEKTPEIKAVAVASKPGLVRFTNPADFAVTLLWGSRGEDEPDGSVRVPAGETRTVRVHHERLIWIATNGRKGFFTFGRVSVTLPEDDRHPPVKDTDGVTTDTATPTVLEVSGRPWFSRTPAPH